MSVVAVGRSSLTKKHFDKTAFVTHNDFFWYTRVSFVLNIAPATIQQAIEILLAPAKKLEALVYLDVPIAFSKRPENNATCHIRPTASSLRRQMWHWHWKSFFSNAIDYLWYVITPPHLHIAKKTIDAKYNLRYPTTTFQLRSFLQLYHVYHRWFPNFSKLAAFFNKRLMKGEVTKFVLKDRRRQILTTWNRSQLILLTQHCQGPKDSL